MKKLAISGYSGSGKTTLLKQVIPLLKQKGISVALVKHTHHDVDLDTPGKDTYELRKAGADQTVIINDNRWVLMQETTNKPISLDDTIGKLDPVDLVLVEGAKHEKIAKITVHRHDNNKTFSVDDMTIAVVSDVPLDTSLPKLDINNPQQVTEFIIDFFKKQ